MPWTPTHITWDLQIMLMWILLPPIFIVCALLPFAAPLLYRDRQREATEDVSRSTLAKARN